MAPSTRWCAFVITAVPDPEATLDEFAASPSLAERSSGHHLGAEAGCSAALNIGFAPSGPARRPAEFEWARLARWPSAHGGVRVIERRTCRRSAFSLNGSESARRASGEAGHRRGGHRRGGHRRSGFGARRSAPEPGRCNRGGR